MDKQNEPGIPAQLLEQFQKNFDASEKNRLAQNICTTHMLWDGCKNRSVLQNTQHCFSHKVEMEGKPITDQKQSGRCWIFACLNLMRIPFMKKYSLEEFEFSQTYLYFWDKVERANFLLDAFVECAKKGETYEGRLIHHLLFNPAEDGGQWDMLTNIVEKYGVVPKVCFPEANSAQDSRRFGRLINNRLREFCMKLHNLVKEGVADDVIEKEKSSMMEEIYRVVCIVLGTPPKTVKFQYYTKDKDGKQEHKCLGPMTPRDFYHKLIKPDCLNMEDLVCVVNDPRAQNAYNKLYTVEYLGNMTGGKPVLYINKPIEFLKEITNKVLTEAKEPVWFGCDVTKNFDSKNGFLDLNALDLNLVFGVDTLCMNKAERLMFCESLMTHAMMFTAVNLVAGDSGKQVADKWRVQNSWGDADGDKGYLTMTDGWFSEFVYEVVVSKKLLDQDTLDILKQKPVVLPAWDPMGALAKC